MKVTQIDGTHMFTPPRNYGCIIQIPSTEIARVCANLILVDGKVYFSASQSKGWFNDFCFICHIYRLTGNQKAGMIFLCC